MDDPTSSQKDLGSQDSSKRDALAAKKRVVARKNVVTIRVEANFGRQKGEGPPSDLWSWRKYGQKPIKGSPYPRGYYRCSTSKGCSAKKQVERCRTDASVLIITYTSNHSHPGPDLPSYTSLTTPDPQTQNSSDMCDPVDKCSGEANLQNAQTEESAHGGLDISSEKRATHCTAEENEMYSEIEKLPSNMVNLPPPKPSEENDFFDELEELPISSSPTGLGRSSFFDEGILLS